MKGTSDEGAEGGVVLRLSEGYEGVLELDVSQCDIDMELVYIVAGMWKLWHVLDGDLKEIGESSFNV